MLTPVESPTGTFSIWKPNDTEFHDADFDAIAASLGIATDAVVWTMTEGIVISDIDGHALSGHA